MSLVPVGRSVTVRTPASSANLGPGFDSLGLALGLLDELTADVTDEPGGALEVVVEGEGAGDVPLDESHLVVRAMDATFDLLGVARPGLRLTCRNAIPHARGLGSSSAAIVGGITLARALVQSSVELMDDQAALQLATDLEGHPDNVAAAQLGGLTISWVQVAAAHALRLDLERDVTVFVPPQALSTAEARGVLPEQVPHRDAAAGAGRAALLVAALLREPGHLLPATEDVLHQPYRAASMPDSTDLIRRLRVDGVPAVVSGAGPTVLAFATDLEDRTPDGWWSARLPVSARGAHVVV